MNETQFQVLQAIDGEPRRGHDIARRAGYAYDSVRRILPRLIELGHIRKIKRGYIRP